MDDCFVVPDTVRLTLSGGHWIDVKKELNTGETRKLLARQIKNMTPGEKPVLDPEQVGFGKVVAYLVDWSFKRDGQKVKLSESAIDSLRPDIYQEIVRLVDAHIERVEQELEERKNETAGSSLSAAI